MTPPSLVSSQYSVAAVWVICAGVACPLGTGRPPHIFLTSRANCSMFEFDPVGRSPESFKLGIELVVKRSGYSFQSATFQRSSGQRVCEAVVFGPKPVMICTPSQ